MFAAFYERSTPTQFIRAVIKASDPKEFFWRFASFERNWKSRENKEVTAIQHYSCKAEAVALGKNLINTSCLSETVRLIKFF